MEHFYRSIQGWFDWENIYTALVDAAPKETSSTFVELGAWKGRSSAYLATEIVNSSKPIKLHIVDAWDGRGHTNPDGTPEYRDWKADIDAGMFDTFTKNMERVSESYNAIQSDIVEAADQFEDGSVNMVWLDTSMDYNMVKNEIEAWLPKIKKGGWIGGHDYFAAPNAVGRAVVEIFGRDFRTNGQCWYVCVDGDSSSLEVFLSRAMPFSQDVGPEQSNAYLRGKYAALSTASVLDNAAVTPDRPEYLRSKYAVKF
jgi:hypothetical protein